MPERNTDPAAVGLLDRPASDIEHPSAPATSPRPRRSDRHRRRKEVRSPQKPATAARRRRSGPQQAGADAGDAPRSRRRRSAARSKASPSSQRAPAAPESDFTPPAGHEPVRSRGRTARRRRRSLRSALVVVVVLALATGAVWSSGYDVSGWLPGPWPGEDGALSAEDAVDSSQTSDAARDVQPTLVLASFDEQDPAAGATQVTILSYDRQRGEASAVLVPTATVVDIPGHGMLQLGRAYGFGEGPLLDATLDNLLGIDLDHVIGISEQGWAALFARVGGLDVDLKERLDETRGDGSRSIRFEPGQQYLDGPRAAELLTFRETGEGELETLPRVQQVLEAMFGRVADDGGVLDAVFDDGAPMLDTEASPAEVRDVFEAVAAAHADGDLVFRTLPVSPVGSGDGDAYRVDESRVDSLVERRLAASVPSGRGEAGRTVQVLNGNGVPGIGQQVASTLVPEGFTVVLTRNADHFRHDETKIILYRDGDDQIRLAHELRDLLGVGEIETSLTPQSVADMTVVVGADYRRVKPARS